MKQVTHIGVDRDDDGDDLAIPLPYREVPDDSFDREAPLTSHRDQLVARTERLLFRPPVHRFARGSVANLVRGRTCTPSRMQWMMQLALGLSIVIAAIAIVV